jgi:hypothetical protein
MDTCPDREVYTIRVDSVGATSNASFVGYMNITLRNVIKAELLSASFHANAIAPVSTSAYYLTVEELKTKFNDRTVLQHSLNGSTEGTAPSFAISNVGQLTTSLVCFPLEDSAPTHRTIFTTNNYFPVEVNFIEPIRQIEKFTVNFYSSVGAINDFVSPTYLTLRVTCAKPNVCQY